VVDSMRERTRRLPIGGLMITTKQSSLELVPDATGTLKRAAELRPLDFAVEVDPAVHQAYVDTDLQRLTQ
jgi:hypothetical protein